MKIVMKFVLNYLQGGIHYLTDCKAAMTFNDVTMKINAEK